MFLLLCSQNNWKLHLSVNGAARGNRFDRPRDQINAEQECNFSSEKFGGLASEFIVFDREKRWGKLSNDQYERIKESGPLCTLQDGRSVSAERSAVARVPGDFMCKIDLKDAYFLVPFHKTPRNRTDSSGKVCYTNFYVYASEFPQPSDFSQNQCKFQCLCCGSFV